MAVGDCAMCRASASRLGTAKLCMDGCLRANRRGDKATPANGEAEPLRPASVLPPPPPPPPPPSLAVPLLPAW